MLSIPMENQLLDMPRFLYSLNFCDGSVYVGITTNLEQRLYGHRKGSCNIGVAKRINKIGHYIEIHKELLLKTDLSYEKKLIDYYKKKGILVLNIGYAGNLGRKTGKMKIAN